MKKLSVIVAVLFLVLAVTVIGCNNQYWGKYSIVHTWYYEDSNTTNSDYTGFDVQYTGTLLIAKKQDTSGIKPVFDWTTVTHAT